MDNTMCMKEGLWVSRIDSFVADAAQIHEVFEERKLDWVPVACHNWADTYPYCPQVKCRLGHTGKALLVEYDVHEESIRAEAEADNGRVWEDSCCELFLQPEAGGVYYNIECNCGGTMLIGCGRERDDRVRATNEQLLQVCRYSSLGRGIHALQQGDWHWQLSLKIPVEALFRHHISDLGGMTARCNVYKCGDLLPRPHFMSLAKVQTPKPDFHRPEFFVPCVFE